MPKHRRLHSVIGGSGEESGSFSGARLRLRETSDYEGALVSGRYSSRHLNRSAQTRNHCIARSWRNICGREHSCNSSDLIDSPKHEFSIQRVPDSAAMCSQARCQRLSGLASEISRQCDTQDRTMLRDTQVSVSRVQGGDNLCGMFTRMIETLVGCTA